MEVITSVNNERIKDTVKLLKSAKERKYSERYIVEGLRMFREIPDEMIDLIFLTQDFYKAHVMNDDRMLNVIGRASEEGRSFVVRENILSKITGTNNPQGIVATVKMKENSLQDILGNKEAAPQIIILERLQDPGNMGTIIRMAEASGCTGILVSYDSVDIYSPKVIRSTMGSIFRVPVHITYDIIGDIELLKEKGISVYGMHLDGVSIYQQDLTGPAAYLIGNEGAGLSEEVSGLADGLLRIPMEGEVESLNAAVSASVICYEVLRQRYIKKLT